MYVKRAFILQDARNKDAGETGEPAFRAASDNENYCMDNEMIIWFSPYVGMIKRQFLESQLDLKVAELK